MLLVAALAGLCALSVTAATATAATGESTRATPCAVPDALRAAGEKEQARKVYVALVRRRPSLACARKGLQAINKPPPQNPFPCAQADASFDRGDLSGALAAYARIGTDTKCAETGIAAVREVNRLCARGRADQRLDRDGDARAAFEAALEKNPNAPCAQKGTRRTRPGWLTDTLNATPGVITDIAVALGVLLAGGFLLLLVGYWRFAYRLLARLPIVRRVLAPRLSLSSLDDEALGDGKVGAAFAAQIKERLQRFREEALGADAPDYDLDFGTARDEFADVVSGQGSLSNSLDKIRDLSDHTKVVTALLDLLHAALPIPRLNLTGICAPPARTGAAATFSLERNGKLEAAATLSGPPLGADPKASDYLWVAQPAAVWAQYEIARLLGGEEIQPDAAESYALVREGLDRQLQGLDTAAKAAYEQALQLNPRNWGALVNLAVLEARRSGEYARSITILAEALEDMTSTP